MYLCKKCLNEFNESYDTCPICGRVRELVVSPIEVTPEVQPVEIIIEPEEPEAKPPKAKKPAKATPAKKSK